MSKPDLAIRDVLVFDGSGGEAVGGDVEVDGGRITSVGSARAATVEIDGKGRALAPGFIDVHTHDDGAVLVQPGLAFKLAQGCTSLVVGNCGFSALPGSLGGSSGILDGVGEGFDSLQAYFDAVRRARPALNVISQVGHNSLRFAAMGNERREPTSAELAVMCDGVERAMEQGAIGLSSGLIYQPGRYCETEELIALAKISAGHGGLYNTHLRNEGDRLLEAVAEALRIGREAGLGVNISHHKAAMPRNWGKVVDSLALIDRANADGQDISLDIYPYIAGSGPMAEYFDLARIDLELAAAIRLASCPAFPAYEGRHLTDIATETGEGLDTLITRILTAKAGRRTICIQFLMTEADVETNLRHPRVMIGSDGIPDLNGRPHPRLYGTFPRVLGHYVRELAVLPLAEAIRRMTSLSADRFGLVDRGRVMAGAWADLVLFDPASVADTATWDDPQLEPAGISHVVVNGIVALAPGGHTGNRAGRPLRYRKPS